MLRRLVPDHQAVQNPPEEETERVEPTSIRWRLASFTALVVSVVIGIASLVTYWSVSRVLHRNVDVRLDAKADSFAQTWEALGSTEDLEEEVELFKAYNPSIRISVQPSDGSFAFGDTIAAGGNFQNVSGPVSVSARTVGDERILTKKFPEGEVISLAQDMSEVQDLIANLGGLLIAITVVGVLLSMVAGIMVSTSGLRPLRALRTVINEITATQQLRPIPVVGDDEIADLTRSFNSMLASVRESQESQRRLVADASHELKTPLTSMRTNIELLLMAHRAEEQDSSRKLSKKDREDLERDVIAQMDEVTELVEDMLALAREESGDTPEFERIDLQELLEATLERAERRSVAADLKVYSEQVFIYGDAKSLDRAAMNLLDNAVKWSPECGVIEVDLRAVKGGAEFSVRDQGPGIPPNEQDLIFERFYRSVETRSQPGSGLGLSIVKQIVDRHGGTIQVRQPVDGGTRMVIFLTEGTDPSS